MKLSLTLSGLVVMLLATFAKSSGVNIEMEALNVTVATIVQFGSVVAIYYGRYRQGDVSLLGFKKNK